jgi:hypothetical protein
VTLTNVLVTDSTLPTNTSASNNYSINVVNPNVGYSVSGTVIYTGSKTGWVYLELSPNSGCGGCNQVLGTAINATTANSLLSPGLPFTIHGVPIGTYTLKAWMDNLGYGTPNASNPTRNVTGLTVTSSGLSGQSVTLADPSAVSLGTLTPAWDPNFGLGVFNGGAVVSFDPICSGSGCNNGGLEMPTRYNLEYSTDPTFNSGFNHQFFPADGGNSPWVVTGLTNGQTYYFRAAGWVGSTGGTNTAAEPSGGLLIGAPSTGSLLSGTVTFTLPTGVSASGKTLYVGCYQPGQPTVLFGLCAQRNQLRYLRVHRPEQLRPHRWCWRDRQHQREWWCDGLGDRSKWRDLSKHHLAQRQQRCHRRNSNQLGRRRRHRLRHRLPGCRPVQAAGSRRASLP